MDQQQELLLWQWSSAVQVTSLAMIAAFFALLARFNPRAELRWWTLAWLANLVALSVTLMYWSFQPASVCRWSAPPTWPRSWRSCCC